MKSKSISTTCCYCGVGCGITVTKDSGGQLKVSGDKAHPVNQGQLCSKGMNLHYTVMDKSDRLLYPAMRYNKNLPIQRVSWDQALDRTAAVFKTLIEKFGPDSVAFYVSGQCLTEEYYVANKLMKGFIGSNNIDSNSRLCMSSAVAAYKMALGEDSVPGCYEDLELADCLFICGANPAWCHPILWRRVEAARAANPDLKIIVSDPRQTQTCGLADLHLQIRPGTDITLHHAISRLLIENKDTDNDFIEKHTEGFAAFDQRVNEHSIEAAAAICGVSEKAIRQAAAWIGRSKGFMTLWTMGINQSVIGVNKNLSLINLHLITGKIGKPGSGPFSLTGQPNAMGGREAGGLANLLGAHMQLNKEADRAFMQNYWSGTKLSPKQGLTATQMFEALEDGRLKAIWIIGTNPLVSLPDVRRAEAALKKAKFVVVQEISDKPETLAFADVILPAAAWAEKEGTMTNSERRVTLLSKITDPPGAALPDAEILCRFARKMGYSGFDYTQPSEIFDEHVRLTAGTNMDMSGLSYAVLREKRSVQWPFPKTENVIQGTQRLFTDHQFFTATKKANIHSFSDKNVSEMPSDDFPLILTTGRIRDQWHTMSKTGKVNKLNKHIQESFVELHPSDALARGIIDEDLVVVCSRRGEVRVRAKIATTIRPGVIFLPMHWGKILRSDLNRANNVTNSLLDPVSSEPDFKFSAVQVAAYRKPKQKIVIVGAGAGALAFIQHFRAINQVDDIQVFSAEKDAFYNRIMLPDYISGAQSWEELVKMKQAQKAAFHLDLQLGNAVKEINREKKLIKDALNQWHSYDILILATGSRPMTVKDLPILKGIFTMRTRKDAETFKQYMDPGGEKVIIVGGGLLGIEMAAALNEMKIKVCLLHRSSRLMDKQLDGLGCQLLLEAILETGVEVLFNDEIERVIGVDNIQGVKLRSGRELTCQAVLMAIGTQPNTELALAAGLKHKRGVVVNEYLQTFDPAIYAIGEIAEFNGLLYGITAAAERQGAIVASFLNGAITPFYEGSLLMNILKMPGTDLCSLGITTVPEGDPAYEEILLIDKAKRFYKKCIIHQDRLVGAILIGDKTEFLEYRELIEGKIDLSEKRLELLRSGKKAAPVMGKLVCACGNVGAGNIAAKIKTGITSLNELCVASGAGMGCGSCRSEVQLLLDSHLKESQAAQKMDKTQNEMDVIEPLPVSAFEKSDAGTVAALNMVRSITTNCSPTSS
ncbi:MAG TPA: molybdopterin-dependent oxidoreductase [Arachidicoccus sp.]|nr:molybdopterin-dependent oxidoreductase [Arachidicoccus sp.]